MTGMNTILRNAKGEMITRGGRRIASSPLAESEMALMGLKIAFNLGITKIILEGSSRIIIQALQKASEECPIEIRIYIVDCKNLFSTFQACL